MQNKQPPKQKAVALRYGPNDTAPTVVASGEGYLAEKIIEKAKESDVKLYQDEKLADELAKIELGDNIPEELYEVVAQVLLFISDLDKLEGYRKRGNEQQRER